MGGHKGNRRNPSFHAGTLERRHEDIQEAMNDQSLARLESLLTSMVAHGAELLQEQCKESSFPGRISHESWSNDAGVSMAYISCYLDHDPSAEAIEATWNVSLDEEHLILQADVCYSNGMIIKPILDLMIDFTDEDKGMVQVQSALDESLAEALLNLRSILKCREQEDG